MTLDYLEFLRCPITRSRLELKVISNTTKIYNNKEVSIIETGILSAGDFIYPIIGGIPRLIVEAIEDYQSFLQQNVPNFETIRNNIWEKHGGLLKYIIKKNKRSKQSFTKEWSLFNYSEDEVWNLGGDKLLGRFLAETAETEASLSGKWVLDAGCGTGLLNQHIGACGAKVVSMDFSLSIERAFQQNKEANTMFIQGDVQFPPVALSHFDIVHSSGVIICTNNSEMSFSCLETCVKPGGKISVWLYKPVKGVIHNTFNVIREYTSKLPLSVQYYLYAFTLLPASYVVKRAKGNKENVREMMVYIMDWFSPQYRWEHAKDESKAWFTKRNYNDIVVTTEDSFGYNIIGKKSDKNAIQIGN
jgi:2-polyprenyl-3-methyl-5-hydroxy-6-metoxy-1,4-benzoquinol methylase